MYREASNKIIMNKIEWQVDNSGKVFVDSTIVMS